MKYCIIIFFLLISYEGFAQAISHDKEYGIGISGFYYDRETFSYFMLSGSLNKKNHQVFGGIGYQNESHSYRKVGTVDLAIGYKGYIFNRSKIFRGFGMLGVKGFHYYAKFPITNCDFKADEIKYNTQGVVLFAGLGAQFIIRKRIIVGFSMQLGRGKGRGNKLEYDSYTTIDTGAPTPFTQPQCYHFTSDPLRSKSFYEGLTLFFVEYHFAEFRL